MAEFGTPQRSATTDANAGMVNPPAKQYVARDSRGTSSKDLSGSDKAFATLGQTVGSSLGDALSSMVSGQTKAHNDQRVIDAQARQGINEAVNEVDQVKKRTGWESMIFGENIEYRAAQQRAVENKVQATYLEELAGVDGYAGDTPEQYHKRQTENNEQILSGYADDPDTRIKVSNALAVSGQKLAKAHYKSHYAYNQLQQQETERTRIQQTFDGFNLEKNSLITPEAKTAQLGDITKFFKGSSKPEGMTPMAHRSLMLDVIKTNMKAGNSGPMKAAQAVGLDKNLSAGEQGQWDAALSAYDTHFAQNADLIRTTADIQIESAVTPDQVRAAANTKQKDLEEMFNRASGTQRSDLIMARGDLDVAKDMSKADAMQARLDKERLQTEAKANKKLAELEVQRVKDDAVAGYFASNDPSTKAGLQRDFELTKKEKEQGFDTHLVKGSQKFVGGTELPTTEEFGRALQQKPEMQAWVLGEMKRTGEVSPMVKTILTTATQSTDRLYDEDGNVSEVGRQTVQMVDKLLQSDKGVDLIGGKDAMRQWRITSIGAKAGSGREHTEKKLTAYDANKGKADAAGFTWKSVIGDQNRRDWMGDKLRKLGIPNPTNQMITDELYDYREDVTAFGYDTREADNSLFQRTTNNKTKVFSSNISNSAYLNEITQWTAEDFITTAEKHNFLAGKYADLSGSSEVINSHTQIPNLRWYTKPGVSGMFASSPSANNELFLSSEEMQEIERGIVQRTQIETDAAERREAAATRRLNATVAASSYLTQRPN